MSADHVVEQLSSTGCCAALPVVLFAELLLLQRLSQS
jgi:hypothetical protein